LTIAAARRGGRKPRNPALLALLNDPNQTFLLEIGIYSGLPRSLARAAGRHHPRYGKKTHSAHPMVREKRHDWRWAPLALNRDDVSSALQALLNDPSRNVRIAAAHALGAERRCQRSRRERISRMSQSTGRSTHRPASIGNERYLS